MEVAVAEVVVGLPLVVMSSSNMKSPGIGYGVEVVVVVEVVELVELGVAEVVVGLPLVVMSSSNMKSQRNGYEPFATHIDSL